MNRKIIAVLGLPGAGKSEVIRHIVKNYNWPKVYFGEPTFEELKRLNLPVNEKNEKMVREGLRKKYGSLYYAKEAIKRIGKIKEDKNILLESFYTWDEYLLFKKKYPDDFLTLAIHTRPEIRYKRVEKRKLRPLKAEETQGRDYAQIGNLNQGGPIAMADHLIINESSKKDLIKQVEKFLNKIK